MLNIGEFAQLGQVSPRMLRHYHEIGLLVPEQVDPTTGYRCYAIGQLGRLHRLVALRDLGFSLEQIGGLLEDEPPLDQLRGMLRMRRAQIEQTVTEEQDRLRRVEAHLHALEGRPVTIQDIVVKHTEPLRVAEASDTAPGFGPELGAIFARLYPEVIVHLGREKVRPGLCVAWYEQLSDEETVVVHGGFDIGDQPVEDSDRVRVVDLPVVEVASVIYRGPMDHVVPVYESLVRWIDESGYQLAGRSRELYHEFHDDDHSLDVTELQMPVTRIGPS
jgi:DNA-binding transcriptional MerR regulator